MRVELEHVEKRYGRVRALVDVTLAFPAGARVALIGPNGSGKTTLTRALLGLVAHRGRVLLDGKPPGPESAARTAYVPQIAPQTSAPVGELVAAIASVRGLSPARVAALAARFALDLGDPQLARRPFRALSGGMRQKVLISLALATGASLVVLDEPTASLDAAARAAFFAAFAELLPGATLLLCSHRLEEIRHLVDHVVLLTEGRVAWSGPAEAYLAARAATVVEVRTRGGGEWLAAHGFAAGAAGWWARVVPAGEKLALVREATAALGPALVDLGVRDLDTVEAAGA